VTWFYNVLVKRKDLMSETRGLIRGRGFRERILRSIGAGDLYDRLEHLSNIESSLRSNLASQGDTLQAEHAEALLKNKQLEEALNHYKSLADTSRLIELDYPVNPKVRHGGGRPREPHLSRLLGRGDFRYAERITSFLPFVEMMSKIPTYSDRPGEPHWINGWIPAFDSVSIYAQLALKNPPLFLEIGSGSSTKFARRAISDFGLQTRIVSIDPHPRSEIDAICDEVIRLPLEDAPAEAYGILRPGDMMFFDGSHRSFQNSDVTVFFTEILPSLPNDILVGVHDIVLPADYAEDWLGRYYNEQYLLACWLLGGDRLKIELPLFHCSWRPDLSGILDPLWNSPNLAGAHTHGCAFWFTPTDMAG
jgi:hypothetical protein